MFGHHVHLVFVLFVGVSLIAGTPAAAIEAPTNLVAEAHDKHIDLTWDRVADDDQQTWNVYRAEMPEGPWTKLNPRPHTIHVFSDYVGNNGQTFHYRVTRTNILGKSYRQIQQELTQNRQQEDGEVKESDPSSIVRATTSAEGEEGFLDSIQKSFFRYFWDFGHPVSGLAREGLLHPRHTITSGGTGFGMITIMVGAERGFVSREAAAERLLKMVTFLEEKAERYHGLWSHHLHGATGDTIPFSGKEDNGGDIVESAFLMQGLLTIREYFDADNPTENELRERVTRLWREAEWSWYQQPGDKKLTWHWSKEYGFVRNHKIQGFNECMIAYLLAMASPTHAVSPDSYYLGWIDDPKLYTNGKSYYGIKQPVGWPMGGPLFFTHYSYLGVDPHKLDDGYANYFEANRAISLINRAYCIDNPRNHEGYSELVWGLTASLNPWGYSAHHPNSNDDNGTITPSAAISAFPYTPEESLATLQHFYHVLGPRLWGPFGFYDAFHLGEDWVSPSYLAIDQGPMAPMIENHRTGLPWRMFMQSDAAQTILEKLAEGRKAKREP